VHSDYGSDTLEPDKIGVIPSAVDMPHPVLLDKASRRSVADERFLVWVTTPAACSTGVVRSGVIDVPALIESLRLTSLRASPKLYERVRPPATNCEKKEAKTDLKRRNHTKEVVENHETVGNRRESGFYS